MSTRAKSGFRVGPDVDPDRYVLGAAVASGAEGILYRGSILSAGIELDVAIKMLQPRLLPRVDEWHLRWSEQVELLRSLQVPGVVRVRDGFVGPLPHGPGEAGDDRTLYLVMNWVEGEPLDEWVRRRPDRDPFDVLRLLLGVAVALDLMHSGRATGGVPVVHRDVKPSNIVVTDEGTVLVDFGLTRGLPDGQRLSGVTGTAGYLAPEATEAGVYTPATDRYAMAGVAYFALTGTEPPASHDPDTMRAALSSVPALRGRRDAVDLLMAMLDADPAARPESLANWVGQLRRSSLSGLPEALAPEAPGRHPQPSSTRGQPAPEKRLRFGLPVVAAVVAAVSLLAGSLAFGLGQGNNPGVQAQGLPPGGPEERSGPPTPRPPALPKTGTWRRIDAGPLATRGEPKAVWTGTEAILVGGLLVEQYQAVGDGAAFDPATEKWRSIPPRPVPGRVRHAVWTGEEMITFGTEGISPDGLTTAAAFNPRTNTWREVPLPPSRQVPNNVVWTGDRLLAWQSGATPPGALYDPVTNQWTPLPLNSVPGAVSVGHAVWTGDELAIQGSVTPAYGGPAEQRLFLFHPGQGTWRVSTRPPRDLTGWLFLSPAWTGREVVLAAHGGATSEAATYAYDMKLDRWRAIADPARSDGSGYFEGVRLDDGRVVVRVGDPGNPFQVLDAESGRWSTSGPAPGPLPGPDGALVSTGASVFHWGIANQDGLAQTQSHNAAWLWSP